MKLLFDENLSPKLVRLLEDFFPNSKHVRDVGLEAADDLLVWQYAIDHMNFNSIVEELIYPPLPCSCFCRLRVYCYNSFEILP